MQSPQRILTFFVARTDCPHLGQISLRVLLGRLPPGVVLAPVWAAPPAAPVRIKGGKLLRPILISFQFFESVLAPGTHSHFESGKFSQFWPEPGTNPAQWVRLKTPFRVHPKQPN